jgi:SnoaL-like domain
MALSAEQTLVIHQLISLHGHLTDDQDLDLDRLDEVYAADIVYDVEQLGYGTLRGLTACREATVQDAGSGRVGHHVTNIVVTEDADGQVFARSKGIGILADGSAGSVVYEDRLRLTANGWRIAHRVVRPTRLASRRPLAG